MSDVGMGEQRRAEAISHPDPRAWEPLLKTQVVGGTAGAAGLSFPEKLKLVQLKLAALRDAVLLFPSALVETSLDTLESRESRRNRWQMDPAWLIRSQEGCHIEEVRVGDTIIDHLVPTRLSVGVGNRERYEEHRRNNRRRFCACPPPGLSQASRNQSLRICCHSYLYSTHVSYFHI